MPTMDTDTTAILMPTMDTTTARGPLMPRLLLLLRLPPLLRLMPMLSMVSMDMAFPMPAMDTDLPTTDTTDIPMPMATLDTTARGLLMLSPLLRLMLTTDTTAMPTPTDTAMPTVPMDTTATPTDT